MMHFRKMHGCGNDFVVLQASALGSIVDQPQVLHDFVRRICDRHYGIGADGLLAWESHADAAGLHIRMHYWNADGSRAEMCGNGARCVVRDAWEDAGRPAVPVQLRTDKGVRAVHLDGTHDEPEIAIDMGPAEWRPDLVPFVAEQPAVDLSMHVPGLRHPVNALSMGNPHAIVFVEDRATLEGIDLQSVGAALSTHPRFPRGANVSFVFVDADTLHVRVWERGVGPTLACGTASCAALAAARRTGRLDAQEAIVQLPGGRVQVREAANGHLWLAGPASSVAQGVLSSDWLTQVPETTHE